LCIASLHSPFQIFPSSFQKKILSFSFFAPWSCRLLFINLFCLLRGAIHFSSSISLSPLSYRPRYSFLSMILLVCRLVCLIYFCEKMFLYGLNKFSNLFVLELFRIFSILLLLQLYFKYKDSLYFFFLLLLFQLLHTTLIHFLYSSPNIFCSFSSSTHYTF
jgi:hypothetical protein